MTDVQLDLLSRTGDTDTARAAADSLPHEVLTAECAHVLEAITEHHAATGAGATAFDVARRIGNDQGNVARRITTLIRLGAVVDTGRRRPGRSNRQLRIYMPAPP